LGWSREQQIRRGTPIYEESQQKEKLKGEVYEEFIRKTNKIC